MNARAKRAKLMFFVVKYANLWRSRCRRRRRGYLLPDHNDDDGDNNNDVDDHHNDNDDGRTEHKLDLWDNLWTRCLCWWRWRQYDDKDDDNAKSQRKPIVAKVIPVLT